MIRVGIDHLNTIKGKLDENHAKITELKEHVVSNFHWRSLPQSVDDTICAVDGSRMETRLCGGILYAVSANVIGRNIDRRIFEMNILFDSHNFHDRIRRMMTLEYRVGAIAGAEVDLILMDGTPGALIPPTFSDCNPYMSILKWQ